MTYGNNELPSWALQSFQFPPLALLNPSTLKYITILQHFFLSKRVSLLQCWKYLVFIILCQLYFILVQFSSVAQSCLTLCDPMNCSTPGLPVHHQLPQFIQTHVHWNSDAIQPSHPLSSPSPPAFNLSQHQGLLKWVSSSHQVAKGLEFQLQHQSFQWIFRTDFL